MIKWNHWLYTRVQNPFRGKLEVILLLTYRWTRKFNNASEKMAANVCEKRYTQLQHFRVQLWLLRVHALVFFIPLSLEFLPIHTDVMKVCNCIHGGGIWLHVNSSLNFPVSSWQLTMLSKIKNSKNKFGFAGLYSCHLLHQPS